MTVMPQKASRTARAAEAVIARHAELGEVLDQWASVLAAAADRGDPVRPVRNLLRAFLADEVLPHARAEERTLYRAARRDPGASLLVQALIGEHRALASRAERLGAAGPACCHRRAGRGDQCVVRQPRDQGGLPAAARGGAFWRRPGRAPCPGAPPGRRPVRGLMPGDYMLSQLDMLEAESIHVMREVAAEFERPALLFSGGKDSVVMLALGGRHSVRLASRSRCCTWTPGTTFRRSWSSGIGGWPR